MKTIIGLPCLNMVHTSFLASFTKLHPVGEIHLVIERCSLTYDARNNITIKAFESNADRILMIDSDMTFNEDMMQRMSARLDEGCDMVCGLFFKRSLPTVPVIYKQLAPPFEDEEKNIKTRIVPYTDYPRDSLFEVEGCGFGAVMMTTELAKAVWETYKEPAFHPYQWCGEDMAFCYKVRQMGRKIWCDSSIKVGHTGEVEFNETTYLAQLQGRVMNNANG